MNELGAGHFLERGSMFQNRGAELIIAAAIINIFPATILHHRIDDLEECRSPIIAAEIGIARIPKIAAGKTIDLMNDLADPKFNVSLSLCGQRCFDVLEIIPSQ